MRIPTKFLLSQNFYSVLLSYMRIPTKFLLSRYSNYFLKQIKYRLIQHQAFRLSYFGF